MTLVVVGAVTCATSGDRARLVEHDGGHAGPFEARLTRDRMREGAVAMVHGGNVPHDGRPHDLGTIPRRVVPMISDNWFRQFI